MEQRHRPFGHFHPLQGYSNLKYNVQIVPNFAQKIPIIDIWQAPKHASGLPG